MVIKQLPGPYHCVGIELGLRDVRGRCPGMCRAGTPPQSQTSARLPFEPLQLAVLGWEVGMSSYVIALLACGCAQEVLARQRFVMVRTAMGT